ncbi:LOW QUALITY PROTEIN: hypothetical protein ACHAW6_006987, partial [Cyclotella cf. meneghiniana]
MDTRVYEVCFPDGRTKELAANTIAEAYAQYDPDGNQYIILAYIMDYRKNPNEAISWNNQVKIFNLSCAPPVIGSCVVSGRMAVLLDRSYLKEYHLLQVAEFTLATGITNEPAFNWLVTWVLKKRDWIISLWTHKFGIELPKPVDEAYTINKSTGTTFWCDAIELEVKHVWVAFDVHLDGVAPPLDHHFIKCHMIFDVKMEDFCHKARL